jgi:hypothetical protein
MSEMSALRILREDSAWLRRRVVRVRTWALAHGRTVGADALTSILLAAQAEGRPVDRWTEADVEHFVWAGYLAWCSANGITRPGQVVETLWSYLTWLHETDGFAEGSDPLDRLRRPLRWVAGLGPNGRLPVPRSRRRSAKRPVRWPAADVVSLHPAAGGRRP